MTQAAIDPDAFNAFEAAGWERKAAGYDRFFGHVTGRLIEPLLDTAHVGPQMRVLDVATGPGYGAALAAERGAAVIGVDIAEAMLSVARLLHPHLQFRRADAQELPFDDGSFDAVVANFAILHLGRPEQAMGEFVRALSPGGRVALTAWDVPAHARLIGVFLDAVAEAGATPPEDVPTGPDFFRFSHDDEFDALLGDQGLEEREVRRIAFTQRMASPDELWEGLLDGTVRTSALVSGQSEDTRRRIRTAFDRLVGEYRGEDGIDLPVSVKLGSGRKPY